MTSKPEAPLDERAKFEASMRLSFPLWTFQSDGVGGYHNHATEAARIAWEIGRALLASPSLPSDERSDLQWQRLPEIRAKFLDYFDDPTDQNALRIINACRERFAARAGQQEQAVLSDLSDEQIVKLWEEHFIIETPCVVSPVHKFARAILAASADLDRGLLEQALAALECTEIWTKDTEGHSRVLRAIAAIRSRLPSGEKS